MRGEQVEHISTCRLEALAKRSVLQRPKLSIMVLDPLYSSHLVYWIHVRDPLNYILGGIGFLVFMKKGSCLFFLG